MSHGDIFGPGVIVGSGDSDLTAAVAALGRKPRGQGFEGEAIKTFGHIQTSKHVAVAVSQTV